MIDTTIDFEQEGNSITLFGDWERAESPSPRCQAVLKAFYEGNSAEQICNDYGIGAAALYDILRTELYVSSQSVQLYKITLAKWRDMLLIKAEQFKESVPFAVDKDAAYLAGFAEGRYVATMEMVQTIVDVINQIAARSEKRHEAQPG